MKRGATVVVLPLVCLLAGCVNASRAEEMSIEQLTRDYRDSRLQVERLQLLEHIAPAFATLAETRADTYKITEIPRETQALLMKKIDWMGYGARRPEWVCAYSCNGFLYVVEFTCLVKRSKVSSDTGVTEVWVHDIAQDFLLFEGVPVVEYPPGHVQQDG